MDRGDCAFPTKATHFPNSPDPTDHGLIWYCGRYQYVVHAWQVGRSVICVTQDVRYAVKQDALAEQQLPRARTTRMERAAMYDHTTLPQRIWRNITVDESGCWVWEAHLQSAGYAQVMIDGQRFLLHRLTYTMFVGPIPDGLQIDHLCRVRRCVNPEHLDPVTPTENTMRGESPHAKNAAKKSCLRGHPLTGENLYLTPNGARRCRTCRRLHKKGLLAIYAV